MSKPKLRLKRKIVDHLEATLKVLAEAGQYLTQPEKSQPYRDFFTRDDVPLPIEGNYFRAIPDLAVAVSDLRTLMAGELEAGHGIMTIAAVLERLRKASDNSLINSFGKSVDDHDWSLKHLYDKYGKELIEEEKRFSGPNR